MDIVMCVYLHNNRTVSKFIYIFFKWIKLCVYIYTKRTLSTFIYTYYFSVVFENQFICLLYISLISMYICWRSRSVNAVRIYEYSLVVVQYIYQSPKFKTDHRNETQYWKPGFMNGGPTFLLRNFVSCGFFTFSF